MTITFLVLFSLFSCGVAKYTYIPPSSPVINSIDWNNYLSRHDPIWSWGSTGSNCFTGYTQLNDTIKYDSLCGGTACSSLETCLDESATQCENCPGCTSFGLCPVWKDGLTPQLYGNTTPYASNSQWTTYVKGGPLLRNHTGCTGTNGALAWEDSAFFGNGITGGLLRSDTKDPLRMLRMDIGRTDIYDRRTPYDNYFVNNIMFDRPRLPVGYIQFTTNGNITQGTIRIHLYNATISGFLNTTTGTVSFLLFTHRITGVFFMQFNTTGNEIPNYNNPNNNGFSMNFVPLPGNSTRSNPPENYQYNPLPTCTGTLYNDLMNPYICTQDLLTGSNYATAFSTVPYPFSSSTATFLTAFYIANDWPLATSPITANETIVNQLSIALENNGENFYTSIIGDHNNWWNNIYWPESYLSLPDTAMEATYVMQMYKYACAATENGPAIDLMGPWWEPSGWELYWFDMNVPVTYWALYAAGRFDLASTLTNYVFSNLTQLQMNVQPSSIYNDSYGVSGVAAYDLNSTYTVSPGQQLGNLPWLCQNLYMYASYMGNDTMLQYDIYPLLRGAINVYRHFSFVDENGITHLPPTSSPEYPYPHGPTNDTNYDLMLFSWGVRTLLELSTKFNIDDPLIPYWQNITVSLTPFPRDMNHGYNVSLGVGFDIPHRHFSHLFAMYPLHLTTYEILDGATAESRLIFMQSLDRWTGLTCVDGQSHNFCPNGFTFVGAASMSALMNDDDSRRQAAVGNISGFIQSGLMHASTLYSEGHQPCFESPPGIASTIQEVLIQSWGGRLRIFPSVPSTWSDAIIYNLAAENGYRISAVRSNYSTQWISISTPLYDNFNYNNRTVQLSTLGMNITSYTMLRTIPSNIIINPVYTNGTLTTDITFSIAMNSTIIVYTESSITNNFVIQPLVGNSSQYNYWGMH